MDWEDNSRDVEILAKTPPTQNPIVNVSKVFVNVRSTRYIFGGDYHSKLPKVQDRRDKTMSNGSIAINKKLFS